MSSFFNVGALAGNPFSTTVGQKIEQATDGSLSSENWALNMEICDIINTTAEGPKDAIKAIKKRLTQSTGKNYTIVMYTLTVLETCVKNCGKQFHSLACNKEFVTDLVKMIGPKNDPPTIVQEKVLSLIQCWADTFQHQPDLQGVVQVYQELKTKGVEFPMTDLDAMAPIYTPQRSVPQDEVDVGTEAGRTPRSSRPVHAPHTPLRSQTVNSSSPAASPHRNSTPPPAVSLSPQQASKLEGELALVQGNMAVMADMLNEMTTAPAHHHHPSDLELLNELAETIREMQNRVASLVARLPCDDALTADLLRINDELNGLLLRHSRFVRNRGAAGVGAGAGAVAAPSPSSVLGAALGVPLTTTTTDAQKPTESDALIDLSDDLPNVGGLSLKNGQNKDDDFDMFAQSRNLTYESTKTSGSSYADNLESGQANAGLATLNQSRVTTGQPQGLPQTLEGDAREFDEIAAWLNAEKTASSSEQNGAQESVTSIDFDKFLAERAAAAETLPSVGGQGRAQNQGQTQTPRHRHINKDDDSSLFAL